MLEDYFRQYGLIAIFVVVAFIVPTSMLVLSFLLYRLGHSAPEAQRGEAGHL